jgi:hypothetical protein
MGCLALSPDKNRLKERNQRFIDALLEEKGSPARRSVLPTIGAVQWKRLRLLKQRL